MFLFYLVIDHFVIAFQLIKQIGCVAVWSKHHRVTNPAQYLSVFLIRLLENRN